jgi:uncharacterized membrane protein YbhN (UPF0104 family)
MPAVPATRRRWLLWGIALLFLLLLLRAGWHFPWRTTGAVLASADPVMLFAAMVVGFLTFFTKGWAWHLLLRPLAPHGWWAAQEANLLGAAANNVSVAVIGEAVRVRRIVLTAAVPVGPAVASVVWVRAVEAVGLALFVLSAPLVVELPAVLRGAEMGASIILAVLVALFWFRRWSVLPAAVPAPLRRAVEILGQVGPWQRLLAPTGLAYLNWIGQWASFHLAIVASGIPAPGAASLAAVLVTNLGGMLRLTPANVGVMQAGFMAALLPFGVPAAEAIAASLLLQAAQIAPVMLFALSVLGWSGLRDTVVRAQREKAAPAPATD